MMPEELSVDRDAWPERPWIMAAIGAAAGFLFYFLVDGIRYDPEISLSDLVRQSLAAALAVATLSFLITAERTRWTWAVAFALIWGGILGLVAYSGADYNRNGEFMGFPFLSSMLAVGIAGPLFQALRDEGRRSLPYEKVHRYAWTDAIIGGASLAFTGLTFAVAWLLAMLFDAIGIAFVKDLLEEGWFAWAMAGAAFGAASAVLRERDPLLGTLQRLVMLVFSVLAPVLAVALALFLIALPLTGFGGLWKSGLPETPLLLSAAGCCFVFLNAIVGDSADDRKPGKLWRFTEYVLLFAVLPLALLALVSMGMRVGQYGWTPERIWGVIASLVAIAFGAADWFAFWHGRKAFDEPLREYQKRLAIGVCGIAVLLALPILDFGAISTSSQLARLEGGKVKAAEFDWAALKYDFGPAGRAALERYAQGGTAETRALAQNTLKLESRYEIERAGEVEQRAEKLESVVEIASPDIVLTEGLRRNIANMRACGESVTCKLFRLDEHRLILLVAAGVPKSLDRMILDERKFDGVVEKTYPQPDARTLDMARANIEVREVPTKQVFVNGQAVGAPFE